MVIFVMLVVVLLPHAVCDAQIVNCGTSDPHLVPHKYYQPGDFIIGSIVFQNKFLFNGSPSYQNPPQPQLGSTFIQNYQHVLALEFAVKEINENGQLLPNITLGFSIYDSYLEARWTYHAALQLISPKDIFAPNYKCDNKGNVMAVTEELTTDIAHQIIDVLAIYKIPQMIYGSAAVLMDKYQALSVYQQEPSGVHQYQGILQLLLHFKWTWIGFIAADEMNLGWFRQVMFQEFSKKGICFAIMESFSSIDYDEDKKGYMKSGLEFHDKIMNSKVNVVVLYGDTDSILCLVGLFSLEIKSTKHKPKGKVWILTAQMQLKYSASYHGWNIQDFHGILSFATHSKELQGFQGFVQNRNLSTNKEDGFIKDFWENAFRCTFSRSSLGNTERPTCTGEERMETIPEYIFQVSVTGQSYAIYNAVYAVAHALHAMYVSKSKNRAKMEGERRKLQNQHPWQLHHFLKMVSFNNSAGDQISFDQNRELVAGFDILNWVAFSNQTVTKVKVGWLDPQAPPEEAITINGDAIVWHSRFNQVQPLSVCNANCYPGYRKRKKEGEPFCCYDCIPCPKGTVSDQADMADCFTCPSDHYPNKDQTSCIPKVVVFLTYEEPLGMSVVVCAVSFSLIAALVLRLFMKHRDNPIVQINNRSLTYTLLISLLLCFLSPLLYIGRPTKVMCIFRQIAFGITFTVAVSSVLAKTATVVLAFTATRPGSTLKNWVGKRLANSILLPCSVIQAGIFILCLAISPPFPDADMHSNTEEIILKCNASSLITVYCEMTFVSFHAIVTFILAFRARKLPDAFNEAKFITFSMAVFFCVWLGFTPIYLTNFTKGRKWLATESFCILASCAALLGFMFFPKCYIILWRPQLNSRELLRKRKC